MACANCTGNWIGALCNTECCSGHGTADDCGPEGTGFAACVCDPGFSGTRCAVQHQCTAGKWGPVNEHVLDSCIGCADEFMCPGNRECGPGRWGEGCTRCEDKHYELNGMCLECPDVGPLYGVLVGLVCVVVAFLAAKLRRLDLTTLSIAISRFQVMLLPFSFDLRWPVELKTFVAQLSGIINLDAFEMTSPECVISDAPSWCEDLFCWVDPGLLLEIDPSE